MLRYLLFLFFLLTANHLFAQTKVVTNYYDDEKSIIKERYFVKEGSPPVIHGLYESFFSDGSIQVRGYYHNNVPDSLWMYFYEKGGIKMSGNLKNGKNHGLWQFFYENGNLSMKGHIYEETKEGEWKYYYENNQIKVEGQYKNNLKTGLWTYYYEDGSLKAKATYTNDSGIYKEYYNSGELKAYGLNRNGKSDSTWIYYYENGGIKAKGNYEEGVRDGKWVFYHENGVKSSEGMYLNGDKDGKWVYYHENGNISSEGAVRNGKKEGYWKIFDESGAFKADGLFERGEGEYKEYYESGKLKIHGYIKDNKNQGQWHYYYEDGLLEGECYFENGEGEYTGYYKDGSIYMKGRIRDGKNMGLWEFYKPDGTLAGYYRPYYEGETPSYKLVEESKTVSNERRGYLKPEYKYKPKKFRHFQPVVNEFRGVIIATNPLTTFIGNLPLSIEYYFQERLGYEMQVRYLRSPFYKNSDDNGLNNIFTEGFDASIRQKFYQEEKSTGMFYFAHELQFTSVNHSSHVIDSISDVEAHQNLKISATENRFEYAILFGNRWMKTFGERYIKDSRRGGITIDFYLGIGVGYRSFSENYDTNLNLDVSHVFDDVNRNNFALTPRFGLNFGYVF